MTPDQMTLISQLSALPLHGLLLIGMIVEGIVIRALWRQLQAIQAALDDCLKK